jgi:hypothetical protein
VQIWEDFWAWTETHAAGAYLFRGQPDASPILPKIGRADYSFDRARERDLFNAFERAAYPFLKTPLNAFETLALAQHHGAPTRLVDWSANPLVAAWFAVGSYPLDQDAQIYALDVTRTDVQSVEAKTGRTSRGAAVVHPLDPIADIYLMETAQVSSRITTQRGIFTLHGDPTIPLSIPTSEVFAIPQAQRTQFQARLVDLGIDSSHIFPDLDGVCKSLDWRMKSGKGFSAIA